MRKIYYLSSCSTCARIIKELNDGEGFEMQDIKTESITEKDLDAMAAKTGSFESLFSRRAMKYRGMGLHEKKLSEKDYRNLILEEYTFLKRPVIWIDGELFVGNSKKTVEAVKAKLNA
jgi:arsenate reductase